MSNIKNEVITKLRSDIRAKLDQIGAFVDNELADYIMVLVANQKTKYQMKDDLSLFLGAATDEFVNWLHSALKLIQLNANQSDDKKSLVTEQKELPKVETKEVPKNLSLNSIKAKSKHKTKISKHSAKSNKSEDTIGSENNKEIIKNVADDNESEKTADEVVGSHQRTDSIDSKTNDKQIDDNKSRDNDVKEQNDGEVILHLNPDGGEVDELLQENDVNNDVNDDNKSKVQTKEINEKSNKIPKVVTLKRQPIGFTPSSTIGAVVINKPKPLEEEDNYNPSKPMVGSVASVVRVTQRKSSVPIEMQANKQLLLKAMKDANQSIQPNRKRPSDDLEYTPTPIKKRIGDKKEVLSPKEPDLMPEDLRNYLNVTKKADSEADKTEELEPIVTQNRRVKQRIEYKENDEMSPQFVVTLDGVDHNMYLKNDDTILFDEEMDEELVENQDMMETENLDNNTLDVNKVNERCRFWPSCKNGDECEFVHPSTPCKTFPNCRFGDKCLYIHPNCKFDSMCSRRDCPFTHASRRKMVASISLMSSLLPPPSAKQCKYAPNCKNPTCPYFHPKLCRFKSKCRSPNCPHIHPNLSYSAQPPTVPHPTQLKWKAKNHISERQFSVSNDKESKTTTTLT